MPKPFPTKSVRCIHRNCINTKKVHIKKVMAKSGRNVFNINRSSLLNSNIPAKLRIFTEKQKLLPIDPLPSPFF